MRMSLLRSCRSGIGGSDIAAVFGLSAWKNRYQLYLEKTSVPEPAAPAEPTGPAASLYWSQTLIDGIFTVISIFSSSTPAVLRNGLWNVFPPHSQTRSGAPTVPRAYRSITP